MVKICCSKPYLIRISGTFKTCASQGNVPTRFAMKRALETDLFWTGDGSYISDL
jgi:hypothetical protein